MTPAQDADAPNRTDENSLRYRGWRVVLACFLMAMFLFGLALYGHGVYLAELQRLNGWPASLISGASTLSLVLCNMLAAFTNELVARFGLKRLVLLGLLSLAASVALLAFAASPWQLYAAFALMALGWIGMGTVVSATVVSLWFERRRGFAISIAFTGASVGGVVITPLLVFLVERIGFPSAMLAMTVLLLAVLIPVVLAWIDAPSTGSRAEARTIDPVPAKAPTSGAISRAGLMRQMAFWTIAVPFSLALISQIGFIVHQIALLEPKIGRTHAGFAVSVMTFMAIAGRLGLGAVIDRFDPRLVTSVSLASQAAALLTLMGTDNVLVAWAACGLFGFSVGNIITLPPLIINREFNAASFTVVLGLANAISGTVGSLGPALLGLVRSWSGDYHAALVLCVALELAAAALVVLRRPLVLRPA